MPTMRDAAAAARGPSERRAAAIPAGRGRTGAGRDTAIPLDRTELPRPSLDRKPRGRPRGLADRGTRACRPIGNVESRIAFRRSSLNVPGS